MIRDVEREQKIDFDKLYNSLIGIVKKVVVYDGPRPWESSQYSICIKNEIVFFCPRGHRAAKPVMTLVKKDYTEIDDRHPKVKELKEIIKEITGVEDDDIKIENAVELTYDVYLYDMVPLATASMYYVSIRVDIPFDFMTDVESEEEYEKEFDQFLNRASEVEDKLQKQILERIPDAADSLNIYKNFECVKCEGDGVAVRIEMSVPLISEDMEYIARIIAEAEYEKRRN
ncbi:MAG: hypothetical protein QXS16_00445 [Pyrobaculum sp.]